jgi:hypothetical protein
MAGLYLMVHKIKRGKGRPSKGIIQPGTHISANIPIELAEALRKRSEETGVSITFMIQKAVETYLNASDAK